MTIKMYVYIKDNEIISDAFVPINHEPPADKEVIIDFDETQNFYGLSLVNGHPTLTYGVQS